MARAAAASGRPVKDVLADAVAASRPCLDEPVGLPDGPRRHRRSPSARSSSSSCPDKTFIAALVLSTRYQPLAVWIGVGLAFAVQTLVAVTARRAWRRCLPDALVQGVALR